MSVRYRVYCGPTIVHETAQRLRHAGLNVTLEGTAHLYVDMDGIDHNADSSRILDALGRGSGWTWKDVVQI